MNKRLLCITDKRMFFILLSIILFLFGMLILPGGSRVGISMQTAKAENTSDDIIVENASSLKKIDMATSVDPDLLTLINKVLPRIVVEYGNSIAFFPVYAPPAELVNISNNVTPRIVVEYGNSIYPRNLEVPSSEFMSISNISPRIVIEYTNSNFCRALSLPSFVLFPPSAPSNLQATASTSSITLSWSPSTQGTYPIAGYAIYRGTSQGNESPTPIATVGSDITTYTDTDVISGITYYYYVKAFDNQNPPNYSLSSNEVSVNTNTPTFTLHIPSGWSLISVPFDTDVSLLSCPLIYYFNGSMWQLETATLHPGRGYLVLSTTPTSRDVILTGTPLSSPFSLPSPGSWQLIGNPFVSPCTLSSTSPILLIYFFNSTTSTWQPADVNNLQPGMGYLVLTSSSGTFTFILKP